MANDILTELGTMAQFTITLDALASDITVPYTGRGATYLDNTSVKAPAAMVFLAIRTHESSTVTAGSIVSAYLLRGSGLANPAARTDKHASLTDSAINIVNAPMLGTILIDATTVKLQYCKWFDTAPLGPLTARWSLGVVNGSGQNLGTTVAISGATNATPIVATLAASHGYAVGDMIYVTGVGGNTAANGVWRISVVATNDVTLEGSVGNGAYTSGGTASGNFALYQPYWPEIQA